MADCQGDEARRHADVRGRRQPDGTDDGRGESAGGRKPKTERFLPCAFAKRKRKEKFAKSLFFSTKMGYNRGRLSAFPRFSGLKAKYGGGNHHEQQKFGQDGCGRGYRRGAVLCARPLCGDPSGIPNTNISLQYAVLGLLAAMYGPVAGGLIGFIGHTLIDLSWGGSRGGAG